MLPVDLRINVKGARWGAILMAGASLTACASVSPPTARYPVHSTQLAQAPSKGPSGYKTGEPYQVGGIWYVPHEQPDYDETGTASWYGPAFNQKATADGEIFDMNGFSAAHTTLPLPSMVEVTNLDNGKKLTVRVNDRGPFVGGRIIDLSYAAAQELGYAEKGLAKVRVRYVGPAPLAGPDAGVRYVDATPPKPSVRPDTVKRVADNAHMAPPAWGFHTPLATRLPAGAASTAVQVATAAAPRAVSAAPAAAAIAKPPVVDDDVILTSYKAPAPVSMTTISGTTAVKAAAATAAPPVAPAYRAVKGAAPLTGAELGPPRGERIALPEFPASPSSSAQTMAQGFRIQAGAFSSADNAHRAAAQLASAGPATVEPFQKDGTTLYRVFVPGADDEVAAYAIRDKVAAAGFSDARVVKGGL